MVELQARRLADAGPFTFVAADALVPCERGVVSVHALTLGVQVTTSEKDATVVA